jgi:hypothetical protein
MTPSIEWNPATYAKNARFVSDLDKPVLQLLNAKAGESMLDLGCGDYLAEARRALQANPLDDSGNWIIDYVRLRFSASKPIRR